MHLFAEVFTSLDECVQKEERQRVEESFESFCLGTPWGALCHTVSPPLRSAERMANRLASVLRFWDVLQGLRYAFWFGKKYTLEELMDDIYTLPGPLWACRPLSLRERDRVRVSNIPG